MAFTNPWDVTIPPDTQPANQLGLDIRNLKTDVMERVSALSGTFANRPAPEIVNANWTGLLYFALDTSQVFQWSGAAWVEVTTSIGSSGANIKDYDDYTVKNFAAVAPAVIRTINLPPAAVQSALVVGSIVEIETAFQITAFSGGAPSYILRINGVAVLTVASAAFTTAGAIARVRASMFLSSASLPRVIAQLQVNNNSVAPVIVSSALGVAIDGSIAVPIQDAFGVSATITAAGSYMHIRVRK